MVLGHETPGLRRPVSAVRRCPIETGMGVRTVRWDEWGERLMWLIERFPPPQRAGDAGCSDGPG